MSEKEQSWWLFIHVCKFLDLGQKSSLIIEQSRAKREIIVCPTSRWIRDFYICIHLFSSVVLVVVCLLVWYYIGCIVFESFIMCVVDLVFFCL